ncbi:MAG: acyl-protein synthetase [Candidatus Izemoplasmataceae bacterium]
MKNHYLNKLLRQKDPYNHEKTNQLFTDALRVSAMYHYHHSKEYAKIVNDFNVDLNKVKTIDDIGKIPFIPTLYYKHHRLFSMKEDKMAIKATSSGTSSGIKSQVGMSYKDLYRGFKMIKRLFSYHKLFSLKRVNYFIFGYEPTKHTDVVIMKSAHGFSRFAPAKKRYYAIKWDKSKHKYTVDLDSMKENLIKASAMRYPIRTIGFPAYTYFLLKEMKEEGIKLKMPKGSLVTIGGGWKEFYQQAVDKTAFYDLVNDVLGIKEDHIVEFFGAVEHPVVFPDCAYHHLHIPIYSRVIIRHPDTFKAVKDGEIGLINLLTPLNQATPLVSVMTDDLGRLHQGCACGLKAPYLEIIGRVGVKDIATCAQGAESLLED